MCKRVAFGLLLCCFVCVGCSREKSMDQLIGDLKSSEERDRVVAVRLLPRREEDAARVVPALIKSLNDKTNDVRWSAAIGLGYYGDEAKDAIPALQKAEHDRDARVREAASVALSRIDPDKFPGPSKQPTGRARVKL
jgi:HEAT repeat protein